MYIDVYTHRLSSSSVSGVRDPLPLLLPILCPLISPLPFVSVSPPSSRLCPRC